MEFTVFIMEAISVTLSMKDIAAIIMLQKHAC